MDTPGWFIADLCLFFYCLVFFCLIPVSLGTFIFPAKKKIPQNDVSDLEVKFWDQLITPSTSKTEETQGCSRNRKVDTAGNKFVQLRRHIRLDTFSYKYIRIYIHTYYIYTYYKWWRQYRRVYILKKYTVPKKTPLGGNSSSRIPRSCNANHCFHDGIVQLVPGNMTCVSGTFATLHVACSLWS